MESEPEKRLTHFQKISELMDENEKIFWQQNIDAIRRGPIRVARFEKYIAYFGWLILRLIGKKKFLRLFELDGIEAQQEFFDQYLSTYLLKMIFKIAFHPKIYKKRGMASEGLIHSGERNIADFFYSRFRDFCSSTIARNNYYLQFTFFNKVLFTDALPEYLTEEGVAQIRKNYSRLKFHNLSFNQALSKIDKGKYNKFALSNLCDWMDKNEFTQMLHLIKKKACSSSRLLSRYIHYNYPIDEELLKYFKPDYKFGEILAHSDRYPFYSLIPFILECNGR
jgi:S-adenosylmethionine:diacylglycerol 3-amino-3-carboxypropyl transferase